MKKTKTFPLILITIFVLGVFSSIINVYATTSVSATLDFSYNNATVSYLSVAHPTTSAQRSGVAETFNATVTGYIYTLEVVIVDWDSNQMDSGVLRAYLYGCGNALNAVPNGTVLDTSQAVSVSTLLAYGSDLTTSIVTFTFDKTYQIVANTKYAWAVIYESGPSATTMSLAFGGRASDVGPEYSSQFTSSTWNSAVNNQDIAYRITVDSEYGSGPPPPPPPQLTFQVNIIDAITLLGAPTVNDPGETLLNEYLVNVTQGRNYTIAGNVLNGTMGVVNGTYYIWKTPIYDGVLLNDSEKFSWTYTQLLGGNVALNETGDIDNGFILSSFVQSYVYNSTTTYQGLKINGTVTGTSETIELNFMLMAAEPSFQFVGTLSGGHFGGSPAAIATAPTEVYLQQNSIYTYAGTVWLNDVIGGNGTFITYSTGLGSSSSIFTTGTYSQVAAGNVSNGVFTFNLASRQASTDVYEGYRVTVALSDGKNFTVNYYFRWSVNVWTSTPVPTSLFGGGGLSDTSGLSGSMTTILNFLLLFLLIGAPAFILGVMGGLPGLIIGAVFGLGIGAIAGLIPFWFIFLAGSGTVAALFMWRKNNGQ